MVDFWCFSSVYFFSVIVYEGSQCMRYWLTMAGVSTSEAHAFEEKTRYYQLCETKIQQEYKAILKVLLPPNIVEKHKVCTSKSVFDAFS